MALDFPQSPQLDEVFVAGDRAWKWNGYAWDKISAGTGTGIFGVVLFYPGAPDPGEVIFGHVAAWPVFFPDDMSGSQAHAATPAPVETDFQILKNSGEVGLLRFNADSATGTFLTNPAFSLAPGDVLEVVALNSDLSDIYLTLSGTR